MPVLMIHGGRLRIRTNRLARLTDFLGADIQYPVDVGRQTYDLIPAKTVKSFHIVEDGPHMIWWTHAERVNSLFMDFMRSQTAL